MLLFGTCACLASKAHSPTVGPMVVHCSAGVGRTGTLIAIDYNLDRANGINSVDICGCLNDMRRQRSTMVQTEEQYIFIYRALADALASADTEFGEVELRNHVDTLLSVNTAGASVLTLEFQKLSELATQTVQTFRIDSAQLPANKPKNRFQNILPYEHTRVKLKMVPGVVGSDYINASMIDGHKARGAYIATQGPLEETVKDFWKMIWEHEVDVIVMLSDLIENGRAKCDQYWPDADETSMSMGDLSISLTQEQGQSFGRTRVMKIVDEVSQQSRQVLQCQFLKWPTVIAVSPPQSAMVDMLDYIRSYQDSQVVVPMENLYGNASAINEQARISQLKPLVVHDSAGVGRTGAFCALHYCLKALAEEEYLDVFSTVKHLRTQRMSMVQTPDQYHFIYRTMIDTLDARHRPKPSSNRRLTLDLEKDLPRRPRSPKESTTDGGGNSSHYAEAMPTLPGVPSDVFENEGYSV